MKLMRFGEPGKEKPGLVFEDGTRINAPGFGRDYDKEFFGGDGLAKLQQWAEKNASSAPKVDFSVRLGSAVCRPSKKGHNLKNFDIWRN